jgi:hypothetical protein
MEMGLGLIRKALFIATFGLSGIVLKDDAKKPRTARAAKKPARPAQAKARAQKPAARRSRPKSARASAKASAGGTARELERLAKLHGEGALTDAEFSAGKASILGAPAGRPEPSAQPAGIGRPYPAVEANVSAARQLDGLASRDRPAVAGLNRD